MTTAEQKSMRVSVIVPVRCSAATLARQLEALLNQQIEEPFEIVIADNGPDDELRSLIASFPPDKCVYVDASARRGAGAARNMGVANAKGEIIAFCDADDVVSPNWLSALIRALDRADLAGGTDIFRSENVFERTLQYRWNAAAKLHLMYRPFARGGNCAWRRESFEKVGGFDESYLRGQDLELAWRAQLYGCVLVASEDAEVHYTARSLLASRIWQSFVWGINEARIFKKLGVERTPAFWRTERAGRIKQKLAAVGKLGGRIVGQCLLLPLSPAR